MIPLSPKPTYLRRWHFTVLQDDRVQGLTLARRIYTDLGLKRVALLRVNSRYGRFGVIKFRDASRRLGHPVVIEQKFVPGDTDFTRALKIIQSSRADSIVLWTDEIPAAKILKQMKGSGDEAARVRRCPARSVLNWWLRLAMPLKDFEAVFPYDPLATIQSGSTSTRGFRRASTKSLNSLRRSLTTR